MQKRYIVDEAMPKPVFLRVWVVERSKRRRKEEMTEGERRCAGHPRTL